jgi:ankyrin repeat protein
MIGGDGSGRSSQCLAVGTDDTANAGADDSNGAGGGGGGDADIVNTEGTQGNWSILCCAAQQGDFATVKMLIDQGADTNFVGRPWRADWDDGPYVAAPRAPPLTTRLAAEYDADGEARNDFAHTPASAGYSVLMFACFGDFASIAVIKALLDAGAAVDYVDDGGRTALMEAARYKSGRDAAVALQLQRQKKSPLTNKKQKAHNKAAWIGERELAACGVWKGVTALHMAIAAGRGE